MGAKLPQRAQNLTRMAVAAIAAGRPCPNKGVSLSVSGLLMLRSRMTSTDEVGSQRAYRGHHPIPASVKAQFSPLMNRLSEYVPQQFVFYFN